MLFIFVHMHTMHASLTEYTCTIMIYHVLDICVDQHSLLELMMLRPLQQVFFFCVQQAEDGTTQQVQRHRLGHSEGPGVFAIF